MLEFSSEEVIVILKSCELAQDEIRSIFNQACSSPESVPDDVVTSAAYCDGLLCSVIPKLKRALKSVDNR